MKHFRTYVITKKSLIRTGLVAGGVLCTLGFIAVLFSAPRSVPAFSDNGDVPKALIDSGLPSEDKPFDIKGFVSGLIGFDKDDPESIIEGSSALFREDNNSSPKEPEIITAQDNENPPVPTDDAEPSPPELPPHDEIIAARGLKISNATSYNVDLSALCREPLEIYSPSDEPQVLIMHTHTTECFVSDEMPGESERTTDEAHNMCAVGDVIEHTLAEYGIKSIHDKTIHDYPTYQGSYTRALNTITSDLEKYPSIRVVLDVHRDAFIYSDGSKLRVAHEINGSDAAQVMLVLGTDSMGLYHPKWQKNLALACKVHSAAEIMYPGLMRPINLRRERFNMHVTTGSLLMEIGSNGNTLSEALAAGEYIARALAAALING